ncbi:translation initiation factor eIF-2B subunit family protein [Aspergillus nomiae NRRL 13137]|uniref:Translation initiation factor eIF-2B subunit family protein n=1 Tax=Aspergillus nomiae NRRL (strain ATCC 15546 / NRRL 13137 / CBS 260.88 / M93) TaxID=1509407 RepID=A0A0L1J7T8_ASPN3|nr:translation initiation factor eIF-2B subunit family protein [Aspergillus nomiae NRRL 13137]KNG87819.1 translation initiation factor eIF-2B subunit family protein [Aspergillus nomiae NRRL 13137]
MAIFPSVELEVAPQQPPRLKAIHTKEHPRQAPPYHRAVLCFIFRDANIDSELPKNPKPNSAQVRKSDRVPLPCGSLEPLLGVIEDNNSSPEDTAWKTIKKQTTIPPSSLSVLRYGKSFLSETSSIGQRCLFYPFAFHLNTLSGLSTDVDNTRLDRSICGWNNHEPNVYDSMDGHYFGQGLRKVWFEIDLGPTPGKVLASGLKQLQHDHESGARKLAAVSVNILRAVVAHLDDPITLSGPWWQKARMTAWHLWKNGRQSMDAAILSFLLMTLTEIETLLLTLGPEEPCDKRQVSELFDRIQKKIRSYKLRLSYNFGSYAMSKISRAGCIPKHLTIITLSASCTIRECITQLVRISGVRSVEIRVLESRPLFEGVSLASSILEHLEKEPNSPKVDVSIFTDASVALAAQNADFLLLAADRIAADGSVSNKTGSLPAALSVRHVSPSADIIVVSELDKVAMQSCDTEAHTMENNESSEVVDAWQQSETVKGLGVIEQKIQRKGRQVTVNVPNVYFEWVPPTLIDAYICEDGVKLPSDFRNRSQWIKEQCERYFDNNL